MTRRTACRDREPRDGPPHATQAALPASAAHASWVAQFLAAGASGDTRGFCPCHRGTSRCLPTGLGSARGGRRSIRRSCLSVLHRIPRDSTAVDYQFTAGDGRPLLVTHEHVRTSLLDSGRQIRAIYVVTIREMRHCHRAESDRTISSIHAEDSPPRTADLHRSVN